MGVNKFFIEKALYPAMELLKGNQIRKNTDELKASAWFTRDELRSLQRKKLTRLLLSAIDNVPAYRSKRRFRPDIELDPFEALRHFDPLLKADYRKKTEVYMSERVNPSMLIPNVTGGSTAEPVRFYLDRETVEYYEAARWRGLSWWDITYGSRSVMVWGNPLDLDKAQTRKHYLKEKWLKNRIVIPAYDLKPESVPSYVARINSYKPEYLYGYASALHALAVLIIRSNQKISVKLKGVVSTSETLYDFQREAISKAFSCPVINEYGARDAGILAFECREGRMHQSVENAVFEVVDPVTLEPLPSGEKGLLLVTDLNNLSMPRLRYAVGDMVSLSDEPCPCGCSLPVFSSIDGRVDDMFVTADGRLIHGHSFNHIARNLNNIETFQIIQHSPTSATLYVVLGEAGEDDLEAFIDGVASFLPGSSIDVQVVDKIPTTRSGKFRYAIRDFPLDRSGSGT